MTWGLEYNTANPKAFAANVIGLVLLLFAWLAVIVRFWARYQIQSIGADDYLVLLAQTFFNVFAIAIFGIHHYTPGRWPESIDNAVIGSRYIILGQSSMAWCEVFLKLSLGAFFLRICVRDGHRRFLYGLMVVSTLINLLVAIFVIFLCGDPKYYIFKIRADQCVSRASLKGIIYLQASINAIVDISFVTIPILLLRSSPLRKNLKISVYLILLLATIGCVASLIRIGYVKALLDFDDFYRAIPDLVIVTHVELATGIIASSLATLKPLLKSLLRIVRTSQLYGSSQHFQPPGRTIGSDDQNMAGPELGSVIIPHYFGEEDGDSEKISPTYFASSLEQEIETDKPTYTWQGTYTRR